MTAAVQMDSDLLRVKLRSESDVAAFHTPMLMLMLAVREPPSFNKAVGSCSHVLVVDSIDILLTCDVIYAAVKLLNNTELCGTADLLSCLANLISINERRTVCKHRSLNTSVRL